MTETNWGRVDASGTVFVRDGETERKVGAFPDASADEALSYFVRKFEDIAVSLNLLERRIATGSPIADIVKNVAVVKSSISAGVGVGDFEALRTRLAALESKLDGAKAEAESHREELKAQALQDRIAIVEKIEAIAASDLSRVNWKNTSTEVDALFAQWQTSQRSGAKVNKDQADELWKRFRNARAAVDRARRAHFATADAVAKEVKSRKESLISEAEALQERGGDNAIAMYRELLDSWKKAGRASKKIDDAMWVRFKAAGDALYLKKKEADEAEDASFADNLIAKQAILNDGQTLFTMTDRDSARSLLISLQKRWDAAGKVPRAKVKDLEGAMRKLELAVKKLDDDAWSSSNPDKAARTDSLADAIADKIAKLERELAVATSTGDKTKIASVTEAIDVQKSWLAVLGK